MEPYKVLIYNVFDKKITNTICFLRENTQIINACKTENKAILKKHFGNQYKKILGIEVTSFDDNLNNIDDYKKGGYIDDIENLLKNNKISKNEKKILKNVNLDKLTFNTEVEIYPDDNLEELKNKIYLATNIPNYRQHIFYNSYGKYTTTYEIHINGIYESNITNENSSSMLFNLPIDKYLFNNQNNIRIIPKEHNCLIKHEISTPYIYVVDLNDLITQVNTTDDYSTNLLYWGYIIKFFPSITLDVFRDMFKPDFTIKYPDLIKDKSQLLYTHNIEKKIINDLKQNDKQLPNSNILSLLSKTTIESYFSLRNLFDKLPSSEMCPVIFAKLNYHNKQYKLIKNYLNSNIKLPTGEIMSSGITICVNQLPPEILSMYININIGSYHVLTHYSDNISYETANELQKQYAKPIIVKINSLNVVNLKSVKNLQLISVSSTVIWKKPMSILLFKQMKLLLEPYFSSSIMQQRFQNADKIEFFLKKGMYKYKMNESGYAYLTDINAKEKWKAIFTGRLIYMTMRSNDVEFTVFDIHEDEFTFFLKIIDSIIEKSKKIHLSSNIPIGEIKKLKRLQESDPELYSIKNNNKKIYSILCQNQRQPIIYSAEDVPKTTNLVKYWNFTTNQPAYYNCVDDKYKYLGFITGVHPKGYCLPCCGKKIHESSTKCLENHKYISENIKSYHILSYGKHPDVGRISRLHPKCIEIMKYSNINNLYQVGIINNTLLSILIDIYGKEIMNKLLEYASYVPLDNFKSTEEAVQTLKRMFKGEKTNITNWDEILISLISTEISIICFIDKIGMTTYGQTNLENSNIDILLRDSELGDFILVSKIKDNYYPIYDITPEIYHKNKTINRKTFNRNDSFIKHFIPEKNNLEKSPLTLENIKKLDKKFTTLTNSNNMIYAVLINDVYIGINFEKQSGAVEYNFPEKYASIKETTKILSELCKGDTIKFTYMVYNNKIIGIKIAGRYKGRLITDDIIHYISEVNIESNIDKADIKVLNYDPRFINKVIKTKYEKNDNRLDILYPALYNNYLYQLFLLEFISFIKKERNKEMRKKIINLIDSNRLNITDLIKMGENDAKLIEKQISFYKYGDITKRELLDIIDITSYEFDSSTLIKLNEEFSKNNNIENIKNVILNEIDKFTIYKPNYSPKSFPNIFEPCINIEGEVYCENRKLIINWAPETLCSLLASDLSNELKRKWIINGLFTEGIIDYFKFIKHPNERIQML